MSLPGLTSLWHHLAGVTWWELTVALAFHVVAIAVRTRAWQNILVDDFPEARVRYRDVLGAYVAGVGVNSVVPARAGDALKLFLCRRAVPGSSYPAILSSLLVIAILDSLFALGYVVYAVSTGVFPASRIAPKIDFVGGWFVAFPAASGAVALLVAGALFIALRWAHGKVEPLWRGFLRGLHVVRDWRFFLLRVVTWEGMSWVLQLCAFWWFLRAFEVSTSLHRAALVQAIQSLAIAVPFTPSGAGAEQALLLIAFEGKIAAGVLASFAIGMRAALTIANVAIGIAAILLLLRTLHWRRVIETERRLHEQLLRPVRERKPKKT